MITKDLKRKEDLCSIFEMDFMEANELFGKETMNGMQLVRVNGGVSTIPWGPVFYTVATLLSAGYELYKSLTSSSTPDPSKTVKFEYESGSQKTTITSSNYDNVTWKADSVVTVTQNGITTSSAYGVELKFGPSQ